MNSRNVARIALYSDQTRERAHARRLVARPKPLITIEFAHGPLSPARFRRSCFSEPCNQNAPAGATRDAPFSATLPQRAAALWSGRYRAV